MTRGVEPSTTEPVDGGRSWLLDLYNCTTIRDHKELLRHSEEKVSGNKPELFHLLVQLWHEGGRNERLQLPPSARRDDPQPNEWPADTEAPGAWSVLELSVTFIRDDKSMT